MKLADFAKRKLFQVYMYKTTEVKPSLFKYFSSFNTAVLSNEGDSMR